MIIYIYDLVPLGHALYYLSMASVYDAWIGKITGLREQMREYDQVAAVIRREKELDEDAILNELLYIKDRINKSSSILTDKQKTAFFFVITAEEMIIKDTLKAAELFAKFDVPLSGIYHQSSSASWIERPKYSRISKKSVSRWSNIT